MSETDPLRERLFANILLTEAAGRGSASLDRFSNWLLGGFGAVLAFLIGNLKQLESYISATRLKEAGLFFLAAAVAGLVEKYIASIVAGAAEASAAGREFGEKFAAQELEELRFEVVFAEAKRAVFCPLRWFVGRSFTKVQSGDLAAAGRNLARWAQIQGIIVVVQAALVLWATYLLLQELTA